MLYDHQQNIVNKKPKKCFLFWEMGTGKSLGSISLSLNYPGDTIVVCLKSGKKKWKREIMAHPEYRKSKWRIYSKEEFKKAVIENTVPKARTLIIDEVHFFCNAKSGMSKSLAFYIKKFDPECFYGLTGTHYRSSPWDVYTLAQYVKFYINYVLFEKRFFKQVVIGKRYDPKIKKMALVTVPKPKDGIEDEIADIARLFGDVVKLDECADVPQAIFEEEYFDMNKHQEKAYAEIEATEPSPVVRYTKYHQIESGMLKGNEYEEDKFFPCDKIDRIRELSEDNKKMIVVCRYNLQIDMLAQEFKDKNVFIIRGDVKDRDSVLKEAEAADEAIILAQAACAEGWEAPSFKLMVFASLDYSFVKYSQMCGRIRRINALSKVLYVILLTEGGIDEAVYAALKRKEDFHIALYKPPTENDEKKLSGQPSPEDYIEALALTGNTAS